MNHKTLALIALVLMGISVFTYNRSVTRGERFERGQKFLNQLNADNIHKIVVSKGTEKAELLKKDDGFVVSSKNSYPAKNEDINRFINDVLNITLEKPVGNDAKLAEELELKEGGEKTTLVVLSNDAGKEMVKFLVGKSSDDGRGTYIQRQDGTDKSIYLTSKSVFLSADENSFLAKDLVDVAEADVLKIQGADFVFDNVEGSLKLANLPAGKKESADAAQVKGALTGLSFEKVYLADDSLVAPLPFAPALTVSLKDNSSYQVSLAAAGEKHYVKIQASYDTSKLEGLSIAKEDTKDQLQEKSDLLLRRDAVAKFNSFHGSWVYELSEFNAKKFQKTAKDLIAAEEAK